MSIKTFQYEGKTYTKIIPAKTLFRSNMVHEATTRGSIFALNIETGVFTILPGYAERDGHNHREYDLCETLQSLQRRSEAESRAQEAKDKLAIIRQQMAAMQQTLDGI